VKDIDTKKLREVDELLGSETVRLMEARYIADDVLRAVRAPSKKAAQRLAAGFQVCDRKRAAAESELQTRRAADLSYQDRSELERLKRADVEQGRRIAALLAERLSDDEREALGDLHARIIANYDGTIESRQRVHLAVLDRLLGGKP
jgi:hypothetical protein